MEINNKKIIGKIGEDLACGYLVKKGYKILFRNFREKWDELDIVALAKDKTLVFVEVKTMNIPQDADAETSLQPEDNLNGSKLKKLRRASEAFAGKNRELIRDDGGWRIDLLAIVIDTDPQDNIVKVRRIDHYENI